VEYANKGRTLKNSAKKDLDYVSTRKKKRQKPDKEDLTTTWWGKKTEKSGWTEKDCLEETGLLGKKKPRPLRIRTENFYQKTAVSGPI